MEDSNAIVIVGAGCIGLCTAYQLSKSLGSQGRKPSIIVVDASDGPFAAASSASTLRGAAASFRHLVRPFFVLTVFVDTLVQKIFNKPPVATPGSFTQGLKPKVCDSVRLSTQAN
ncbi:hypothetical protein FOTG_12856 [Fusarium oxysporum f. sp. vasinfectum 25433]|uniref:FAD dependent oxidoreductase domain-containing protein n=1 Tax=Fusarium oxysporum f. sp. vasinfectum 25433 TaxID=1089449 RepID=X0KZL1_FUSOX|nr:hypothetical protein FOTG_12856 [Fusarium oxysporum f. sp. vasinfectum 25433]